MNIESESRSKSIRWLGAGALLTTAGASVCCVGSFLHHVSLWDGVILISIINGMVNLRPYFIIVTLIFIASSFSKLYMAPVKSNIGDTYVISYVKPRQCMLFWGGSVLLLLILAFPVTPTN